MVGKRGIKDSKYNLKNNLEDTTKEIAYKINVLRHNLQEAENRENELIHKLNRYKQLYQEERLTYAEYEFVLNKYLKGKSATEWLFYFTNYRIEAEQIIQELELELQRIHSLPQPVKQKEILEEKVSSFTLPKLNYKIVSFVSIALLFMLIAFFISEPNLTGFSVYEVNFELNESWNLENSIVRVSQGEFVQDLPLLNFIFDGKIIIDLRKFNLNKSGEIYVDIIVDGFLVESKKVDFVFDNELCEEVVTCVDKPKIICENITLQNCNESCSDVCNETCFDKIILICSNETISICNETCKDVCVVNQTCQQVNCTLIGNETVCGNICNNVTNCNSVCNESCFDEVVEVCNNVTQKTCNQTCSFECADNCFEEIVSNCTEVSEQVCTSELVCTNLINEDVEFDKSKKFGKNKDKVKIKNVKKLKKIDNSTVENIEFEINGSSGIISVQLNGLEQSISIEDIGIIKIDSVFTSDLQKVNLRTDVFAMSNTLLDNATLSLPTNGKVDFIIRCENWDFKENQCGGEWVPTIIPFVQDGSSLTFSVDGFSGYAGASIEILNVYTYLKDGDDWIVNFITNGTANLTISGVNNTNWTEFLTDLNTTNNDEMKFIDLKCGNDSLKDSLYLVKEDNSLISYNSLSESDSIVIKALHVPDYSCNGTAFLTNNVLIAGYATLRFEFGDEVAYAYDPLVCDYTLSACKTSAWVANSVYCLDTSLTPTVTCFKIDQPGITFDCQGYTIDGDRGTSDYGFSLLNGSADNVVINN
ncbi:MAG: hypothetical protein KKF52_00065, partial [Nanoarchaeota archaeon]|nr:hypothetical protein [Nanoarchaeota archaeon]